MLSIFLIWIMDRWMNRWKQQQNIYRVMKPEEGKTLNKRHAWNVWEAWFHGHPPFLFLYLVCFSPPFIPHLSLPLSPIPFPLRGSSVWLFIGNDSHCGRAPLRLRSPPHPSILPPRSVPSAMHYSWLHNQMRELRLVAGDMVHGSSSPKVPWGAPVWYPPSPTPPNPRSGPTCHLPLTPSDTVTDNFFFLIGVGVQTHWLHSALPWGHWQSRWSVVTSVALWGTHHFLFLSTGMHPKCLAPFFGGWLDG